ncbi:TadA family conjugal transfer-associated ATPase [Falsarthrobacter nasiphocae]
MAGLLFAKPRLVDSVRQDLVASGAEGVGALDVSRALGRKARLMGSDAVFEAAPGVSAHVLGMGPLQPFVEDPRVTDVLVNGPNRVWIDAGDGLTRVPAHFGSDDDVRALAQRLIALGGRRVDDAQPCADVHVLGCRVHAVLPPLASEGTLLSIRVARHEEAQLADFLGDGVQDVYVRELLEGLVRSRRNFLVSGATGSGKTTLLGVLLSLAGEGERIIIVEDSAELRPTHPHTVSLQARQANSDGRGEYTLADLVRQAMRMRPDRLVVGECRGAEVRDLLAAMNTGHVGSGGTLHANSTRAVPARLTAMGALAGMGMEATALQASSALDVLIHVRREGASRRICEVATLEVKDGELVVIPAAVLRGGTWRLEAGVDRVEALCNGS